MLNLKLSNCEKCYHLNINERYIKGCGLGMVWQNQRKMNYTKLRQEIEREIAEEKEQESILVYKNMMNELGVEVK